jgi:hypothetical protein
MLKTSVFFKAAILAILIALVFASLPTASAFARGDQPALQKRWNDLVTNFERQSINHLGAHRWVEHWLATNKKASASKRAEIEKHLAICNSALMSASAIVSQHAGFDANGKIVERASAVKSIKDLAYYLRQHAGSIKNLQEHME